MKRVSFVLCTVLLSLVFCRAYGAKKVTGSELSKTGSIMDNFAYELEGDSIVLKKYTGTEEVATISSQYTLGGKTYKTDLSHFMFGIFNEYPKAVVFEEGIESFYDPIFNSTKIEKVYIPYSMKFLSGKQLSYLHANVRDKALIFYAGTQEEFSTLVNTSTGSKTKTGSKAEQFGAGLADALNSLGGGFNASDYDFVFEATIDDFYSGEFD